MAYISIKSIFSYIQDEIPSIEGNDGLLGITLDFKKLYILYNGEGVSVSGSLQVSDYLPILLLKNVEKNSATIKTETSVALNYGEGNSSDGEVSKSTDFDVLAASLYNSVTNKVEYTFISYDPLSGQYEFYLNFINLDVNRRRVKFNISTRPLKEYSANHTSSDFQVALDENFETLIVDSVNNIDNKNLFPVHGRDQNYWFYDDFKLQLTDVNLLPYYSGKVSTAPTKEFEPFHTSTDWQIATDENFTDILVDIQESTMAKRELIFSKPVKYRASMLLTSLEIPVKLQFVTYPETLEPHFVHNSTDGQIATDPNFTNIIVDIQDSTENLNYIEYVEV